MYSLSDLLPVVLVLLLLWLYSCSTKKQCCKPRQRAEFYTPKPHLWANTLHSTPRWTDGFVSSCAAGDGKDRGLNDLENYTINRHPSSLARDRALQGDVVNSRWMGMDDGVTGYEGKAGYTRADVTSAREGMHTGCGRIKDAVLTPMKPTVEPDVIPTGAMQQYMN